MRQKRQTILKVFREISDILLTIEVKPERLSLYSKDNKTFNLDKLFTDPIYSNLLLIFESGPGGGAKFSYRSDKKFTITIFINKFIPNWNYEFPRNVYSWFSAARSSFVHEFIHYLEFKDKTREDLLKIQSVNVSNNQEYYNHPAEISAFTHQGMHDIEWFITFWEPSKQKFEEVFGKTKDSLVEFAINKFFDKKFIKYLSKENLETLELELESEYDYFIELASKFWS